MGEIKSRPIPSPSTGLRESGGDGAMRRRVGDDGRASIECPNCGGLIDFHAGHIGNGRVLVCEEGRPLMREIRYRCRHCDSTVVFLRRCEPEGGRP